MAPKTETEEKLERDIRAQQSAISGEGHTQSISAVMWLIVRKMLRLNPNATLEELTEAAGKIGADKAKRQNNKRRGN